MSDTSGPEPEPQQQLYDVEVEGDLPSDETGLPPEETGEEMPTAEVNIPEPLPASIEPTMAKRIREVRERLQRGEAVDSIIGRTEVPSTEAPSAEALTEAPSQPTTQEEQPEMSIDSKLQSGQERRHVDLRVSYLNDDISIATNIVPEVEKAVRKVAAQEKIALENFSISITTDYPPKDEAF